MKYNKIKSLHDEWIIVGKYKKMFEQWLYIGEYREFNVANSRDGTIIH